MCSNPCPVTSHTWCATELEWERLTYRWDIPRFTESPIKKRAESFPSSRFTISNSGMSSTWRLLLYPFGVKVDSKSVKDDELSLSIEVISSKRTNEVAYARLSIIRNDGDHFNTFTSGIVEFYKGQTLQSLGVLISRSVLLKNSEQLLPGGTLSIEAELFVLSNTWHRSGILECPSAPPLVYSFDPSCSPDCSVTLDSSGPITFHQAIIHASSPTLLHHLILLSQVDQKKKRGKKGKTTISSLTLLTAQVLRDLIDYVYHDTLPDLPEQFERVELLFKVAHEYSVSSLKSRIETSLIGQLGTLEPTRLLLLARETKSNTLEWEVTQYVGEHREVMRGKRWLEAITNQSDLMQEQARKMNRTSVSSRVCNTSNQVSSLRIRHQWFLIHFDKFSKNPVESLCFQDAQSRTRWRLRLHPNGLNPNSKEYLSIELVCLASCSRTVPHFEAWVSIGEATTTTSCCLNANAMKIERWVSRKSLFDDEPSCKQIMTIKLDLKLCVSIEEHEPRSTRLGPKIDFPNSFLHLLTNGRWSDVTIVVAGDFKFLLHQVILAAVSPVFKAMFSHEMTEKIDRVVHIDDIDGDTFRAITQFIYAQRLPLNVTLASAEKILIAAEKYQIEPLKRIAEQAILELLNIENVAHILVLAEKHQATSLFDQSIQFIKSNLYAVMMTTAWVELFQIVSLRDQLLQ